MTRLLALRLTPAILSVTCLTAAAQAPKTDEVVARVNRYIANYGMQLTNVVAEETYRQHVHEWTGKTQTRTLRSDYALTRERSHGWIGYRDTFEVDGHAVRDREARLQRLLSSGALDEADAIMRQNSRFNLANNLLSRNVNVPTFAIELLNPRNQGRFSNRRLRGEAIDGRDVWTLEFRERSRPTLVRTPTGGNQATRIVALVDPSSGEVRRTTSTWEEVRGSVVVSYGRVEALPVLVPLEMKEQFTTSGGTEIEGTATYANYRQFETSGRLVEP